MRNWIWMLALAGGCAGYGGAFQGAARVAEVRCERAFACRAAYPESSEQGLEDRYGTDVEACEARLGPDPALRDAWDAAEDSGELTYDQEAAKACATALSGLGCEAFWTDVPPESCDDALTGTLPLDAACDVDAVCASGLCQEGRCAGNVE